MPEDLFEWVEDRIVTDYESLAKLASALRTLNQKVVLTIGTYDFVHGGHLRYLWRAKAQGDILIVGLDSDEAVRRYKGPNRPMVNQGERMEFLVLSQIADYVTLIEDVNDSGAWQYGLLKSLRPHIFVAEEESYSEQQLADIRELCDELVILPRQSTTSSSERIRRAAQATIPDFLEDLANQMRTKGVTQAQSFASIVSPDDTGDPLLGGGLS